MHTLILEAHLKARARMDRFPGFTIGEVAHRAGVAASAIRYYESLGLLPPPQRVHGDRRYSDEVFGSLAFIAVAQSAGFSLREIDVLVRHVETGPGLAEAMRVMAEQKLAEVEAILARTRAMKDWLEVARECGCSGPDECSLFPTHDEIRDGERTRLHVLPSEDAGCRREPS